MQLRLECYELCLPLMAYPDLGIRQRHGGYLDWRVVPCGRATTTPVDCCIDTVSDGNMEMEKKPLGLEAWYRLAGMYCYF